MNSNEQESYFEMVDYFLGILQPIFYVLYQSKNCKLTHFILFNFQQLKCFLYFIKHLQFYLHFEWNCYVLKFIIQCALIEEGILQGLEIVLPFFSLFLKKKEAC